MKQNIRTSADLLTDSAAKKLPDGTLVKNLRRIFLSPRVAGSGFIFVILLLNCLLTGGCRRFVFIGEVVVDDHVWVAAEFENVRFEALDASSSLLSIQSGRAYWLKRGERITVKSDTFEFHWERQGEMCSFTNNTSDENCKVCDLCNPPPSFDGPPCFGLGGENAGVPFNIVADPGFIQTDTPRQILSMGINEILGACNLPQNPVPIFEPEASGLYRAVPARSEYLIRGETNGEIKLHIVEPGESLAQKTAYQLTRQTVDGTNYWTWTIEGNPLWLENFSPNLRVTDVRILRGRCADGSAQGKQCAIPDESVAVKPSRLLFLPNFQGTVSGYPGEAQHRCYNHPNANGDAFINLTFCRERNDTPAGGEREKFVVPTYEIFPSTPFEKLTWFIEFNTNEGADADLTTPANDPMPTDAELIIEFTIQAN